MPPITTLNDDGGMGACTGGLGFGLAGAGGVPPLAKVGTPAWFSRAERGDLIRFISITTYAQKLWVSP